MFAERRTASVPGRIRFLIVSISTINGISGTGVPCGIKWASRFEELFSHPNNIRASHAGMAKDSVNTRCLEAVKI